MSQSTTYSYDHISNALQQVHIDMAPAEMQGIALGFLCVAKTALAKKQWHQFLEQEFEEILTHDRLKSTLLEISNNVFDSSQIALGASDFSLALCLPDDKAPLEDRVEALGAWCKGFMYGLGVSGQPEQLKEEEIQDALSDLAKMTDLSLDLEDPDEDERAYIELVEYVRMVPLMIQEHIHENEKPVTVH